MLSRRTGRLAVNAEFPKSRLAFQNCQLEIPGVNGLFITMRRTTDDVVVFTIDVPLLAVQRPFEAIRMACGGFHKIRLGAANVARLAEVHLQTTALCRQARPASACRLNRQEHSRARRFPRDRALSPLHVAPDSSGEWRMRWPCNPRPGSAMSPYSDATRRRRFWST